MQLLDGISTTTEVHFYNVPELDLLVLGRRGENCTSELVELKTSDPNFVGTFNLTFTLQGTLVCFMNNYNSLLGCMCTELYILSVPFRV